MNLPACTLTCGQIEPGDLAAAMAGGRDLSESQKPKLRHFAAGTVCYGSRNRGADSEPGTGQDRFMPQADEFTQAL